MHMSMGEVAGVAIVRTARDLVLFPVWWYTRGVGDCILHLYTFAKRQYVAFGIGLWLRNMFVPMYGQYDWQGRVMSFLVRGVQVIARSFAYGVLLVGCLLCFVGYMLLPPALMMLFFAHATLAV